MLCNQRHSNTRRWTHLKCPINIHNVKAMTTCTGYGNTWISGLTHRPIECYWRHNVTLTLITGQQVKPNRKLWYIKGTWTSKLRPIHRNGTIATRWNMSSPIGGKRGSTPPRMPRTFVWKHNFSWFSTLQGCSDTGSNIHDRRPPPVRQIKSLQHKWQIFHVLNNHSRFWILF